MSERYSLKEVVESATILFAGDSGDGMQLTGTRFSSAAANAGNDIATFPNFPAEIRAPAGTTSGVSGFQIQFSSSDIHTPGDQPDVLVAMNLAALKNHISSLSEGGLLIFNSDNLTKSGLRKAGYESDPFEDGSLSRYRIISIPINRHTLNAVEEFKLPQKEALRSKNFFALGVIFYLFDRELTGTEAWIEEKFAKRPDILGANINALRAGHSFADTAELFTQTYQVGKAELDPGTYRSISGNEATAMGFITAAHQAGLNLFYGSYPITPATDVLHELSKFRHFGVRSFQAEDEIAAMAATIGAAYGGCLAFTGTSGPGLCLKTEAMNLAVMAELPVVILNVQRGGPSTGLPTKTEQSDLLQALWGRNGSSPIPVLAPRSPADCFDMAIQASKIALKYMTPVVLLSDGYLGNGAEPWRVPEMEEIPEIPTHFHTDPENFQPYARDSKTLSRPWAIPGTPGLQHRIGGLEKEHETGDVSMDPENHSKMVRLREAKVEGISQDLAELELYGDHDADLLIVGWGSTYGAIYSAVKRLNAAGHSVAGTHFRYLNPMPPKTAQLLQRFKRIVVAELNTGQLDKILAYRFGCESTPLQKVQGLPFTVTEICDALIEMGGHDA